MWRNINYHYFTTIADLIHAHNEQIRQRAIDDVKEFLRQKALEENEDESEDESEDENEDE